MQLTFSQRDASRALLAALDADKASSGLPDNGDALLDVARDDMEEDWLEQEPMVDSDEEVYEDDHSPPEEDEPFIPEHGAQLTSSANALQTCILDILISLYTHLPSGRDDKFYSPILRFIVLFTLRKDGKFLPARQITQIISALLFTGRLVMMVLMHRNVVRSPDIRYTGFV